MGVAIKLLAVISACVSCAVEAQNTNGIAFSSSFGSEMKNE